MERAARVKLEKVVEEQACPDLPFLGMRDLGTEDPNDAKLEVDSRDELRYRVARDGDSLVCPFQCELCHFCNIQHRNPLPDEPRDDVLLATMRRAPVLL